MIRFPEALLDQVRRHAERTYPNEACGLIVGRNRDGAAVEVTRIEASRNLAAEPARSFEIDFGQRLALQRLLRGSGEEIVGLYHSHPDGSARPSAADLERAWEEGLVWVIVAVAAGRAEAVTAHRLVEVRTRFEEISLRTGTGPLGSGGNEEGP
ncbi:MAG: M67 family metallopeptidase [Alphaproteobacteria bacterium]|jgi:proteasome lid subunit RPN8/RPN11|nr:M67 family metallopeptidase [Alphaproteobacteria bacterium]